jgi:hypothetical protein
MSPTTVVFLIIIAVFFIYFCCALFSANKALSFVDEIQDGKKDVLEVLKNSKVKTLRDAYVAGITINTNSGNKTNIPSSEIFTSANVCKCFEINMRMLDAASGILVGLGLLGTFVGLTFGIQDFDSSSTALIQESIQGLLSGMGTAFWTSLAGMITSIIFTLIDKWVRVRLFRRLHYLTEKLDAAYYIDDMTLLHQNQQSMMTQIIAELNASQKQEMENLIEKVTDNQQKSVAALVTELQSKLTYKNEEGAETSVANAVRVILRENEEQSKALKSFSTDLALSLNEGFDEVLSRQMQAKIVPLMENVDKTTNAIVEHIDQMAATVSSPATDLLEQVVGELKESMSAIIEEFKRSFATSASKDLENLARSLASATQALGDIPNNMANISNTLQITIEEVKKAISDISNTSAVANSTAMSQMQEQIAFATGAISNAIEQVKEVMTSLTSSSQEQSSQMINQFSNAAAQMGAFMDGSVSSMVSTINEMVQNITKQITENQSSLLAQQENSSAQTKELLDKFIKDSLMQIENVTDNVASNSQEQNDKMIAKLTDATEKMSAFMSTTMTSIMSTVNDAMQTATSQAVESHTKLLAQQENTSAQTTALMNSVVSESMHQVKSVTEDMAASTQEQNNQLIAKVNEATDKMGAFLNETVSALSTHMQDSMRSITDDINDKQLQLLSLQEETAGRTKTLLDSFNIGLEKLSQINEVIMGTMNQFQLAQGQISGSTAHLQNITGEMKSATELFNKSQNQYVSQVQELQQGSQQGIESLMTLVKESGDTSEAYVHQFETIKMGLSSIFSQLQQGLKDYSNTVQASTQKYLDQYATSLTSTTDALSSAIQQQSEVVEMLVDTLKDRKS